MTNIKKICLGWTLGFGLLFMYGGPAGRLWAGPAPVDTPSLAALHALEKWLALEFDKRPPLDRQEFASVPLTRSAAARAKDLLWQNHLARDKEKIAAEWDNKLIHLDKFEMKFDYRIFGTKPLGGRSLYISLHGGGGTAPRINDAQWRNQIRLYQPEEGLYLAPRAPTNTWDLWHQKHIDAFFDRLIEGAIIHQQVNPNRVYLLGYSAGGDGVYQLAPRMADRWAAAAMMSGHPNDASPLGLRNIGFTLHAGGLDAAYNRNRIAAEWKEKLRELRRDDPNGYSHEVVIHEKLGHWMERKDAVALSWMAQFTRNPLPDKIVWKQDNVTHDRLYWLAVPSGRAQPKSLVIARRRDQQIHVETAKGLDTLIILLNEDLMDLDKPITVLRNQKRLYHAIPPRTIATLYETLSQRPDPYLLFSARITLKLIP